MLSSIIFRKGEDGTHDAKSLNTALETSTYKEVQLLSDTMRTLFDTYKQVVLEFKKNQQALVQIRLEVKKMITKMKQEVDRQIEKIEQEKRDGTYKHRRMF